MSKHTQGKWETAPNAQPLTGVVWAGVEYICTLDESERVPKGSPEFMANARLIVEAPAMRDALIECRKVLVACKWDLKWFQPKGTETPEIDVLLERIDSLLARIEGTDNG